MLQTSVRIAIGVTVLCAGLLIFQNCGMTQEKSLKNSIQSLSSLDQKIWSGSDAQWAHEVGRADGGAWSVSPSDGSGKLMNYGLNLPISGGSYEVRFDLQAASAVNSAVKILTVYVYDVSLGVIVASHDVMPTELANLNLGVSVPFEAQTGHIYDFRARYFAQVGVELLGVELVSVSDGDGASANGGGVSNGSTSGTVSGGSSTGGSVSGGSTSGGSVSGGSTSGGNTMGGGSTSGGTTTGGTTTGGSTTGGGTTTGGNTTGGNTTGSTIVFTENSAAPLVPQVIGVPVANSILQREGDGKAPLQFQFGALSTVAYYKYKQISGGTVVMMSNPAAYTASMNIPVRVSTGLAQSTLQFLFFDASGKQIQRWESQPFSVGEVFLVAGQSNAANHGQTPQTGAQSLNRAYSPMDNQWVPLKDMLPFASNSTMSVFQTNYMGGSPWPRFGDLMSAQLGVPIGIVSTAWGGSSVEDWMSATTTTYTSKVPLVTRLEQAATGLGGCRFRAVLWHQGEQDGTNATPTATYVARLKSTHDLFVSATHCSQTWVVARASFLPTSVFGNMTAVRDAQTQLWSTAGYMRGPDTDFMVGAKYRFDQIHFTTSGLPMHGQLWFERVKPLFGMSMTTTETMLIPEAQQVVNLYKTILFRSDADMEVDYNGLFYHVRRLEVGETTLDQIKLDMQNSDEAFIRAKYVQYRNRQPTIVETRAWAAKIAAGTYPSRDKLEQAIKSGVNP